MNKKVDSYPMKRSDHGVWRMRVEGDLSHALYCYFVERNGCVVRSLDPLKKVPFVKPEGKVCGTDAILYEANVRDMTSSCLTGTKTNGKYVSLCEDHTQYDCFPTGLNYLSGLGVTHIQLIIGRQLFFKSR